jgi:protein-disulfide isomerase
MSCRAHALLLVAMAVMALSAGCVVGGSDDPTPTPTEPPTTAPQTVADVLRALDYPLDAAHGRRLGNPDAPAHLQVFVDFRCPHCMNFTAAIEPLLVDEYVRTGSLLLEVRDFPVLGPASVAAAVAARCAEEQDRFWQYHKGLFVAQAEEHPIDIDLLFAIADDSGLDRNRFDPCLEDLATLADVEDDYAAAQAFGLTGTPGFVLNGDPIAGLPASLQDWRAIIEPLLP